MKYLSENDLIEHGFSREGFPCGWWDYKLGDFEISSDSFACGGGFAFLAGENHICVETLEQLKDLYYEKTGKVLKPLIGNSINNKL